MQSHPYPTKEEMKDLTTIELDNWFKINKVKEGDLHTIDWYRSESCSTSL
jgi:hypothetical protein